MPLVAREEREGAVVELWRPLQRLSHPQFTPETNLEPNWSAAKEETAFCKSAKRLAHIGIEPATFDSRAGHTTTTPTWRQEHLRKEAIYADRDSSQISRGSFS